MVGKQYSTRPGSPHSFLSAFNNKPSWSHWNAARYVLHNIHSTINYRITFTSTESSPLHHVYMFYPCASDTEAYSDAIPPKHHQHHHLTTYSNTCWGSQLRNAILEGIQLPLFRFRSMSGATVMHSGGPISWKAEQQERSSLSLCEAEIQATNTCPRLTIKTQNMIFSLSSLGYPIHNTKTATPLYNDNKVCIKWCHNMTTKGNCLIEQHENAVWDGLPTAHSPSCMSVGKQIFPACSPKKCAMVQTSDASEILSCATQVMTTSAYAVLSTTLLCLCKRHSISKHLILAFSRFSSLTAAFVFQRPIPAYQAPAAISYLVIHPLFLCRLL